MKDFNINLFNKKIYLFIIIAFCFSIHSANAQRFKGSAVLGLNFAQIDGDAQAGFSKLGLTGGFKMAYPLKENVDLNVEMLYNQTGSTSGFGFGSSPDDFVDLKYIEIPVYLNIKDWFIPEGDYHKVKAHAGLSYGYLFSVESTSQLLSDNIDNYTRNSIGYLLGIDYAFTSKLGVTIRYSRAFNSLFTVKAISYYITFRTDYTF